MNIRELKLFRHLASTLHFGKTSQACNITPSGLTRAMQRLEQELKQQLFYRTKRSVRLTPAGEKFREYAEETINRFSELQHKLADDDTLHGELSLFCSVTAILSILPGIVSRFREYHPEVQIHLETGDAANAITKLHNGEADISVAALPDELPPSLEFIELLKTPLIFIGPAGNSTAIVQKNQEIDWQFTPIIVAERGLSRDRINSWFSKKRIRPNIYSQVAGNEAIIAMVAMGCGVGLVPELVLEQSVLKDRVRVLVTDHELKPFTVGICTAMKNKRNPVIEAFWDIAAKSRNS